MSVAIDWITQAITLGQQAQEAIFTDRVRLDYKSGTIVDDLGTATPVWTMVYEGPGLVQAVDLQPVETQSAGEPVTIATHIGKIPHTVSLDRERTYQLTVLASLDTNNMGVFAVIVANTQSWATARRIRLKRA